MQTLWITLTIFSILSQIPHAYWSINKFSTIEPRWVKISQNIVFCSIISIGILGCVLEGKDYLALGGAFVEIIINFYYYDETSSVRSFKKRITKNWLAYFLAILIPMSIYIFSSMITVTN